MSTRVQRDRKRHRGSIRTQRRVRYLVAGLNAALADPELAGHVALLGNLFIPRRGKKVTGLKLANALAAKHPDTGEQLRARVNTGTRQEGNRRVSNVCSGFDIPLAVGKDVSVAALVLEDKVVLKASLTAMRQAARWLGKHMDRRLRKNRQNATVPTGTSAMFFLPEKSGRHGQPQLHAHVVIPNVTTFRENGRKRHCAAHFKRITKLAATAQRRMNAQLARNLKKAGYHVELVDGVCRLPSVSRELCVRFSPVSALLNTSETSGNAPRRQSTKAEVRRRENRYLHTRPAKKVMTLQEWRQQWAQGVGVESLKAEKKNYRATRFQRPPEPAGKSLEPANITPLAPALPVTAYRAPRAVDDALDEHRAAVPEFRSLGVALRMRLQQEMTPEMRGQVADLDYSCPENQPDLEHHTEALRTLLRLVFPRVMVHQKYTVAKEAAFAVKGTPATRPDFSRIVAETATALNAELRHAHVRTNWPSVLRWLHMELSHQAPEPVRPFSRSRRAPRIEPVQQPKEPLKQPKVAADLPAPVLQSPPLPPEPTSEPEMEMLP